MLRSAIILRMKSAAALLFVATSLITVHALAQAAPSPVAAQLAQFDAATIKPTPPVGGIPYAAFLGHPGGRVTYAGNAKMLIWFAYGIHDYQVAGGPDWIASDKFDITAVPPDSSPSRSLKLNTAEPTAEQRQMLQSLLRDRFGLQCHFETRDGEVYILTRGLKPLKLVPAAHPDSDPRGAVVIRGGDKGMVEDGEAFANNATGDYIAAIFSRALHMPVLNQTGLTGAWDFHLDPVDPDNQDMQSAAYNVIDRLGLKIKRGRGPIQTLVIDHIEHPTTD